MRTPRQVAGSHAEDLAATFLCDNGLEVIARNYRTRLGEIDLVARDGAVLVFVEVRMRSSEEYGGALESIDERKRQRIALAAHGYLGELGHEPPCRFDVITVEGRRVHWIPAAFDVAPG